MTEIEDTLYQKQYQTNYNSYIYGRYGFGYGDMEELYKHKNYFGFICKISMATSLVLCFFTNKLSSHAYFVNLENIGHYEGKWLYRYKNISMATYS